MGDAVLRISAATLLFSVTAGHAGGAEISDVASLTTLVKHGSKVSSLFSISGVDPVLVVVRGLGPSLNQSEHWSGRRYVIRDPVITLSHDGAIIAVNDDWQDDPNADQIPEDLQPAFPSESALARTLAPGDYEIGITDAATHRWRGQLHGGVTVSKLDVEASFCPLAAPACQSVTIGDDGKTAICSLPESTCGVDLAAVVQVVAASASEVSSTTPFWFQAWGGRGGGSNKGGSGGNSGYAQTATSLADIQTDFSSTQLYYFIGKNGSSGGETCGGAGGTATILTMEDLSLNPKQDPDSDKILLIAGAGAGGGSHDGGFCAVAHTAGGAGGVAIALDNTKANGSGHSAKDCSNQGGHNGKGGEHCTSAGGDTAPVDGMNGFGGLGAIGGNGADCKHTNDTPTQFLNVLVTFSFDAGQGGTGGGGSKSCDAGGGGGGGGYGGGGGGGHGNASWVSLGGGGGASYARFATQESDLAPTSPPSTNCPTGACVQIVFDLTE